MDARDSGGPGPARVVLRIAALTVGKPYLEPTAINVARSILDNYIGVYQLNEKEEAIIRREGEKLFVSFPGGGKIEINPSSETEFFIKDSRPRLTFTRNSAGLVMGFLQSGSSGPDQEATKTSKSDTVFRFVVSILCEKQVRTSVFTPLGVTCL